ncbi:MAG: FHA domain-containing protein [Planctomycetes bacterium]|nr:FHA domain-containing protein [Planctomycetota bacterium]MCL4729864.1 FHA domain-containing protein [Planctomycetota bacterium]
MADAASTVPEKAAPSRVIVEVLTSSLAGRRFAYGSVELRKGVLLGRAPDCTIRFDAARDLKVSGHHALLEERMDGVFVRDQGSSNGLYLNRERVTAEGARLYNGDELHLGQEGAIVRLLIPGEDRPPVSAFPAPSQHPKSAPASGDAASLTMMVNNIGSKVGAGDKTKHLLKAVAEELEARAEKKTGALVTVVGALFLLIVAAGAIGVWYYQHEEAAKVAAQARGDAELQAREKERDDAEKARQQREKDREKELEDLRRQLAGLQAAMEKQEKLADDLRAEQNRRFEDIKKEVGESTAARLKEISEAQFKSLKEATDEQLRALKEFKPPSGDESFRELVDKYNPGVFLIFVQYPLLDADGNAVGVEGGNGTGWCARIEGRKAWVVTNKHVIKPFQFNAELALSHAIRDVKPAPMDRWTIACWQPGMKLREKVGDSMLNVAQAWAMLPGARGGKGTLRVAGFADDDFVRFGNDYKLVLQQNGFKTELPPDIIARVKAAGIHADTFNDLALLELELRNPADLTTVLPMASEEDLQRLHQMDRVMSLGYPLGMSVIKGTTVTTSPATGEIRSKQYEVGKIGTSAPILPGNSGGPLVSADGKVVGVITRRFEATQGEAITATHARLLVEKFAR